MKYPEYCYRAGTEYRDNLGRGRTILFRGESDEIFVRMGNSLDTEFVSMNDVEVLDSISTETLAELAIEEFEWIIPNIGLGWKSDRVHIGILGVSTIEKTIYRRSDEKSDEPLGEFFLRAAKERNYIT